ncbi:predicted protein [Plenodomus lingam JN3]|uniref:Predicted protein n=1 Tax=Leptosphaeria maculans (strain JN3 / isolate v23.1.3 / race Av1-4-5-6-7-8) TaxID=985895 RepID=E5A9S7_LEPMJ|nr:predicted protein [Plenodomus lingam JN3]CBY00418.1 predicted protein [Plenodomus lingam JN3]
MAGVQAWLCLALDLLVTWFFLLFVLALLPGFPMDTSLPGPGLACKRRSNTSTPPLCHDCLASDPCATSDQPTSSSSHEEPRGPNEKHPRRRSYSFSCPRKASLAVGKVESYPSPFFYMDLFKDGWSKGVIRQGGQPNNAPK